MTPTRNARIVLRLILYLFLLACIALFVSINRSPRRNFQVAKVKLCRVEIANFKAAAKDYELVFGTLPSGDLLKIVKTLRGQNPKGVVFLAVSGRSIDSNGALVDPWQTPYEIRATSTNSFSIRSAGMNRRFGDEDDIVSPP